jgi:hypothetical protein
MHSERRVTYRDPGTKRDQGAAGRHRASVSRSGQVRVGSEGQFESHRPGGTVRSDLLPFPKANLWSPGEDARPAVAPALEVLLTFAGRDRTWSQDRLPSAGAHTPGGASSSRGGTGWAATDCLGGRTPFRRGSALARRRAGVAAVDLTRTRDSEESRRRRPAPRVARPPGSGTPRSASLPSAGPDFRRLRRRRSNRACDPGQSLPSGRRCPLTPEVGYTGRHSGASAPGHWASSVPSALACGYPPR